MAEQKKRKPGPRKGRMGRNSGPKQPRVQRKASVNRPRTAYTGPNALADNLEIISAKNMPPQPNTRSVSSARVNPPAPPPNPNVRSSVRVNVPPPSNTRPVSSTRVTPAAPSNTSPVSSARVNVEPSNTRPVSSTRVKKGVSNARPPSGTGPTTRRVNSARVNAPTPPTPPAPPVRSQPVSPEGQAAQAAKQQRIAARSAGGAASVPRPNPYAGATGGSAATPTPNPYAGATGGSAATPTPTPTPTPTNAQGAASATEAGPGSIRQALRGGVDRLRRFVPGAGGATASAVTPPPVTPATAPTPGSPAAARAAAERRFATTSANAAKNAARFARVGAFAPVGAFAESMSQTGEQGADVVSNEFARENPTLAFAADSARNLFPKFEDGIGSPMKSTGGLLGAAQATGDMLLAAERGLQGLLTSNPSTQGGFRNGERISRGNGAGTQGLARPEAEFTPEPEAPQQVTAGGEVGPGAASPELTANQQATRDADAQIDANLARIQKGLAPSTSTFGGTGQAPGTGFIRNNSTGNVTRFNRPFEFNKPQKIRRQSGGGATVPNYRVSRRDALRSRETGRDTGGIHPLNFAAPAILAGTNRLQRSADLRDNAGPSLTKGEERMFNAREKAERLRLDSQRADETRNKNDASRFQQIESGLLDDDPVVNANARDQLYAAAIAGDSRYAMNRANAEALGTLRQQNSGDGFGWFDNLARSFAEARGGQLSADNVNFKKLGNMRVSAQGNVEYVEGGKKRNVAQLGEIDNPKLRTVIVNMIRQAGGEIETEKE